MTAEQDKPAVKTVASVDLDRYLGDWYEIARYDNRFQRKCTGDVKAGYARKDDGTIRVVNTCRTEQGMTSAEGAARIVDETTRAKLKVRFAPSFLGFLPFVWGDYWIIGLDDNYRWAVVGTPDRGYLWILSRTPVLDQALFEQALEKVRANGFDPGKLLKTRQGS
ncbi:MAG: lipocalin family protein [Bacteroidales bacterium]